MLASLPFLFLKHSFESFFLRYGAVNRCYVLCFWKIDSRAIWTPKRSLALKFHPLWKTESRILKLHLQELIDLEVLASLPFLFLKHSFKSTSDIKE